MIWACGKRKRTIKFQLTNFRFIFNLVVQGEATAVIYRTWNFEAADGLTRLSIIFSIGRNSTGMIEQMIVRHGTEGEPSPPVYQCQ